jgi:double-strand break repair protein MRE11
MVETGDDSTIRILLTTDNHVGYKETDPIRGDDAGNSFHEIMMMAKQRNVDMVLQSGDLFHSNKPSKKSLYQVIRTLRLTCLGDKPCEMEVLNHGVLGLDKELDHVNYEDPNINVAIPVFGISGNHDDSGGASMLSPMDVLSATGLMNYYGRLSENDNITVTPVLLRKGTTKLALYGLPNVRDERLFRTFREGNVKFLRPSAMTDEWFNILAVHQNHASHTETSYLPETFIPDFIDAVIWGHEHECRIDPVTNPQQGFVVIQPGSSVATSLSEGEAVSKHVGILSITDKKMHLEKIPLKTVRPFVMDTVSLATDYMISADAGSKGDITRWLTKRVDDLIEDLINEWKTCQTDPNAEPPLPLVRLRVDYSGGYEVENPTRFSNRFVGRVANVDDVIQYYKRKVPEKRKTKSGGATLDIGEDGPPQEEQEQQHQQNNDLSNIKVQSLVEEFLREERLRMLMETGLGDAISQFVDKDDKTAVKTFVDDTLDVQLESLLKLGVSNESEVLAAMGMTKDQPVSKVKSRNNIRRTNVASGRASSKRTETVGDGGIEDDESVEVPTRPARTARTARLRNTARVEVVEDSDDMEPVQDSEQEVVSDVEMADSPPTR